MAKAEIDLTGVPRFDASSLLREIEEDVRGLLRRSPRNADLRRRVKRTYTGIKEELAKIPRTEGLIVALGDPLKDPKITK